MTIDAPRNPKEDLRSLQIDPSHTNTADRPVEDFPEHFLQSPVPKKTEDAVFRISTYAHQEGPPVHMKLCQYDGKGDYEGLLEMLDLEDGVQKAIIYSYKSSVPPSDKENQENEDEDADEFNMDLGQFLQVVSQKIPYPEEKVVTKLAKSPLQE